MAKNNTTSQRGFAGMSAKKQREIAAKGGRASHGSQQKSKNTDTSASSGQTTDSDSM